MRHDIRARQTTARPISTPSMLAGLYKTMTVSVLVPHRCWLIASSMVRARREHFPQEPLNHVLLSRKCLIARRDISVNSGQLDASFAALVRYNSYTAAGARTSTLRSDDCLTLDLLLCTHPSSTIPGLQANSGLICRGKQFCVDGSTYPISLQVQQLAGHTPPL